MNWPSCGLENRIDSDVPDGWEREAEDPEYFFSFSPDAYAVGIDVLQYSMTH